MCDSGDVLIFSSADLCKLTSIDKSMVELSGPFSSG